MDGEYIKKDVPAHLMGSRNMNLTHAQQRWITWDWDKGSLFNITSIMTSHHHFLIFNYNLWFSAHILELATKEANKHFDVVKMCMKSFIM